MVSPPQAGKPAWGVLVLGVGAAAFRLLLTIPHPLLKGVLEIDNPASGQHRSRRGGGFYSVPARLRDFRTRGVPAPCVATRSISEADTNRRAPTLIALIAPRSIKRRKVKIETPSASAASLRLRK
jgi:hypothetical protein